MRALTWPVVALVAVLGLTACQSGDGSGATRTTAAGGTVQAGSGKPAGTAAAPAVTVTPAKGATKVRPDTPVTVEAKDGELAAVTVKDAKGRTVPGSLSGTTSWTTGAGALVGGTKYSVVATARGADGTTVSRKSTFTTMTPRSTVRATVVPGDDWTVGVAMPVVVTFAAPVTRRDAVVKALTVSSKPAVKGAWRWMNDREVQWRPKAYWPAGTKVVVTAAMGGVETAKGVWGRRTITSTFAIGRRQISTVDVAKHRMTVTRDDKVVKKIPVTTGKRGFLTRSGVKVIMSREAEVNMDAATTGTDPKDPNYYNIQVKWALRLTYSGEFLHAAPWSVGSQGRANVSHGCTGMSTANAKWMYDHSQIGDPVVFTHSPRKLEWGNGYTVWNRSFKDWSSPAA